MYSVCRNQVKKNLSEAQFTAVKYIFGDKKETLKLVPRTCFFLSYCGDFHVKCLILMPNQDLSTQELNGLILDGFQSCRFRTAGLLSDGQMDFNNYFDFFWRISHEKEVFGVTPCKSTTVY